MPDVEENRTLLVPVSLDARVISGKESESVLDLTPRMEWGGVNLLKQDLGFLRLANPLDPQQNSIELKKGIHLNWTLPAALTHGFQTETGEIEFPPVPNRWLVMRISVEPNPTTRAWVIHSDYLDDQGTNDAVFLDQKQKKYVQTRIGTFYEYKGEWNSDIKGTFDSLLTAVGPGNPAFAAFYPGCRNVFGFHDTLQDENGKAIAKGTFLYFVAGWYDALKNDPLQPGNASAKWRARVEEEWLKPLNIPQAGSKPNRTLCHGTLHSVRWDSAAPSAMPLSAAFKVGIGNTAIEALSSLARPVDEEQLEPLLSAFQYDVLDNLDVLAGIPELDAELHRRRFYPVRSGTQWILKPVERLAGINSGKKQAPPFPESAKNAFNKLCEAQREYDRLECELRWFGECYQSDKVLTLLDVPQAEADLKKLETKISEIDQQRREKQKDVQNSLKELRQKNIRIPLRPGSPGNPQADLHAEHELVAAPAPEFWRACDPAIVLSDPNVSEEHRYGSRRQSVKCRFLNGVRGRQDFSDFQITEQGLPQEFLLKDHAGLPFDALKALYYESLWLDPQRADYLSRDPEFKDRQNTFRPNIHSIAAWSKDSWQPLFMVWEVLWSPCYSKSSEWNAARKWEIGSGSASKSASETEYRWTGGQPADGNSKEGYRGWAPLSLVAQLKDGVSAFAQWKNLLTQSTSGLSDRFIGCEQTIKLAVEDKDPPDTPLTPDELVNQWLGPGPRWISFDTPMFSPIRAGYLKLSQVWLVDAFGRHREIIPGAGKVNVTESQGGGAVDPSRWITLPPRIVQPSRLLCSWVSVADESGGLNRTTNSNPDTSPVLGWIVPNYFDRSLVLCDASGRVRNELRHSGNRVMLSEVPDCEPLKKNDPAASSLRQFAEGFIHHGWDALRQLLELIDWISQRIITPAARQMDSASLILGQPLVLARASVELEVWGGMKAAPFGNSFEELKAARFPIRVGDVDRSSDGLIGYFLDKLENNRQAPDYSIMRLTHGAQVQEFDYFVPNKHVVQDDPKVSPGGGRVNLTLIMDPRAKVHFTSGILPTQSLELPEHVVNEALTNIELSFQVRPVLANEQGVRLPLPDEAAASWVWFDPERVSDKLTWRRNPAVANQESGPAVPSEPAQIYEGWLGMTRTKQS